MPPDHGRQFIYEYNGNELKQEIEYDPTGQREVPNVGSVIVRHEKEWKVTRVFAPVTPRGIPLVRVFLSDRRPQPPPNVRRIPERL